MILDKISLQLASRVPVIGLVGYEEERYVDELLTLPQNVFTWTMAGGLVQKGRAGQGDLPVQLADPGPAGILSFIASADALSGIYVLCDLHPYFTNPVVVRLLKDTAQLLRKSRGKNIVLVSPFLPLPIEIEKEVSVIHYPLLGMREIHAHVKEAVTGLRAAGRTVDNDERSLVPISQALKGLTLTEIDNALSASLVESGRFEYRFILEEKTAIIAKSELVEMPRIEQEITGLDSIGGLEVCKEWLARRREIFLDSGGEKPVIDIRRNRIPAPKGIMLLGVQGCGKSYLAKCLAREWKLPFLWLNMGRIFASQVGESEARLRNALRIIDGMAPSLLFIDEMEKAFAGVQSSALSDGGTTARVVGQFLTWMQERESRNFIVATANDISNLPVELLRKGRLDEIFFITLPDAAERRDILAIHLANHGIAGPLDCEDELVAVFEGFSGAEIRNVIVETLYEHFRSQQPVGGADLLRMAHRTRPMSVTRREEVTNLVRWAEGRCVFATQGGSEVLAFPGGRRAEGG